MRHDHPDTIDKNIRKYKERINRLYDLWTGKLKAGHNTCGYSPEELMKTLVVRTNSYLAYTRERPKLFQKALEFIEDKEGLLKLINDADTHACFQHNLNMQHISKINNSNGGHVGTVRIPKY